MYETIRAGHTLSFSPNKCTDTGATSLLNSIVCSGASKRSRKSKPVAVPPPAFFALLNTLTVHPRYTSRVEKGEYLEVSSQALSYLRNVLSVVGPVHADFRTAFQFQQATRGCRRPGPTARDDHSDSSEDEVPRDEDRLPGKLANEGSVWNNGDFWKTIGWAFNCSALHPKRWRFWKIWLDFMLKVLETDWTERERMDAETFQRQDEAGHMPRTARRDSIIVMYMEQQNGRQSGIRAIIKALFADGSDIFTTAFREVFTDELKGPKKPSNKRKREQDLDLENGKFGDYLDDESASSGMSEPPTPQKPKGARSASEVFGAGLAESVDLRLRLFKLISAVTVSLRKTAEVHRLYEEYADAMKVSSLPLFALLLTQRPNLLIPESRITILKELYDVLLPSSHEKPEKVDPDTYAMGSISMAILERCYIPNAANTIAIEDNAKLSLVVESSIQLIWKVCEGLEYSKSFARAAERGVTAREVKAKKKRTGKIKADANDALAQSFLMNSGERIRMLIELMESSRAGAE